MSHKLNLATIAELACLDTDPEIQSALAEEINTIMDFVERLRAVKTETTAPLFHPFDLKQGIRKDVISEPDRRQQLKGIAPQFEDDLFLVPQMIETGA